MQQQLSAAAAEGNSSQVQHLVRAYNSAMAFLRSNSLQQPQRMQLQTVPVRGPSLPRIDRLVAAQRACPRPAVLQEAATQPCSDPQQWPRQGGMAPTATAAAAANLQHPAMTAQWQVQPFDNITARVFSGATQQAPKPLSAVATITTRRTLPVVLQLHIGQLSVAAMGPIGSQRRKDTYQAIKDLLNAPGEAQPLPWVLVYKTCSDTQKSERTAYMQVTAKLEPAATAAALDVAAAGKVTVGPYAIPVTLSDDIQPFDTVELVMQNPPAALAFSGFTAGVLDAAGYADVQVKAEWRGGSKAPGGIPEHTKELHSIIAWVVPPLDDPQLQHLPDTFKDPTTGQTCRVNVRTRLPGGLQHFLKRRALTVSIPSPETDQQQPESQAGAAQDAHMEEEQDATGQCNMETDLPQPEQQGGQMQREQEQQHQQHHQPQHQQQRPRQQQPQQQPQALQQPQQHHQQQQQLRPQHQLHHLPEPPQRPGTPEGEQQQQQAQLHHLQQLGPNCQQQHQQQQLHQQQQQRQQQKQKQAKKKRPQCRTGSATQPASSPSAAEVADWTATSPVWCDLAEQAQHVLEMLDRQWNEQEQQALATAYITAFGLQHTGTLATDIRQWLLQHYQVPTDEEEYGDGAQGPAHRPRKNPVRASRNRPLQDWFCVATRLDVQMQDAPNKPTGAGRRRGPSS